MGVRRGQGLPPAHSGRVALPPPFAGSAARPRGTATGGRRLHSGAAPRGGGRGCGRESPGGRGRGGGSHPPVAARGHAGEGGGWGAERGGASGGVRHSQGSEVARAAQEGARRGHRGPHRPGRGGQVPGHTAEARCAERAPRGLGRQPLPPRRRPAGRGLRQDAPDAGRRGGGGVGGPRDARDVRGSVAAVDHFLPSAPEVTHIGRRDPGRAPPGRGGAAAVHGASVQQPPSECICTTASVGPTARSARSCWASGLST